ncbi:hypothetical protein FIBSPDRAFT_863321 [Athelia psychrophila]|uniref:Uncharacterized protein n=1 Tax=Athelia psychrophila TaxID=1759441 RepID=A0A166HKM2_9AGAM|nr:hypothetical protein FIBSPDRAFT_863321 [Fibularhizoctonia sp. CBS 109695]
MHTRDPSLIFYRTISSLESTQSTHASRAVDQSHLLPSFGASTQHTSYIFSTRPQPTTASFPDGSFAPFSSPSIRAPSVLQFYP